MSRVHAVVLTFAFSIYCVLASVLPPADDEFYYWCWAKELQLSYYDHPPMTAYLIRGATEVFGDTLFATRFPACVATTFVLGTILSLTRPSRIGSWLAVTPLFTVGGILITPDTPLLLFWAAYLLWLVAVHRRLTPAEGEAERGVSIRLWLLGGVLLGCGVLGKYTAGLAGIGGFLTFLFVGGWRRWIAGYVLHAAVAAAVASPILIYNALHDFAPLRYQWEHTMASGDPGVKPFAEFVGVQVLFFGIMPFALLPWVAGNLRRLTADPTLRVCVCLYAFPLAFFLFKAARGPLEGNWALASYIAFWPVAAAWAAARRPRWAIPASFAAPTLVTLGAAVHFVYPLPFIKPGADRVTRQAVKYEVAQQVRDRIAARGEKLPVYTESYQMTARLRFQGIDARQIEGVSRPSHFTTPPEHTTDAPRGYVLWEGFPTAEQLGGSRVREVVEVFPITVRGDTLAYYILLLIDSPAPADPALTGGTHRTTRRTTDSPRPGGA